MNNDIKFHIRTASKNDIPAIINLCKVHAVFEKFDYKKEGKAEKLSEALFSSSPKLYCLVVETEDSLVGYATYMKQFATWDADEYVYMDCLYLEESYRGFGIGEQMMNRISKESGKLGCKLLQWQTPEFNQRATKFYHRIGAISKQKMRFFYEIE